MVKFVGACVLLLPAFLLGAVNTQYAAGSDCVTPNRAAGVCIGIRQCQPLLSILQIRPLQQEAIDFLRQSQCGFDGKDPRVCCPSLQPTPPTVDRVTPTTEQGSNQDPNWNGGTDSTMQYDLSNNPLLSADCGLDLSQKILGGERTDLEEFPWMALLEYVKPTGKSTACGGVLISRRYVLTAAHCVKGKDLPKTWRLESVRLGEYNTETNPDCVQDTEDSLTCADDPIVVGVEEQIAHEEYRPLSTDQSHDIALLRLSRDVRFTNYVKPICLPSNVPLREQLTVAGWGRTENRSSSDVKLKLKLPLANKDECQTTYRNIGVRLGPAQFCAGGQKGKDSCKGDSGGPLMSVERTRDNTVRWSVVGIVSFGPYPCGMLGWPGVYTKVTDFVPWILSKMRP